MSTPQQPELRRSEETPSLAPDAIEGELEASSFPTPSGGDGHVPKGNRPGSTSGPVQDKPDLDAMAAKLGAHKADPSTGKLDTSHPDAAPEEVDPWYRTAPAIVGAGALVLGAAAFGVMRWRRSRQEPDTLIERLTSESDAMIDRVRSESEALIARLSSESEALLDRLRS